MSDQLLLFDNPETTKDLLPFTYTRPVGDIRVGILTIAQKWEKYLHKSAGYLTSNYLEPKFPRPTAQGYVLVDGSVLPTQDLAGEVEQLAPGSALIKNNELVALRCDGSRLEAWWQDPGISDFKRIECRSEAACVSKVWDIFLKNVEEIPRDFELLTAGRSSQVVTDPFTRVYGPDQVFLEEGVQVRSAVINALEGPVYLAEGVEIQEGAVVKGPVSIGRGSSVSMGAKIRGNVSIGPFCKVGGEVINSVMQGYSNKSHDGFLGCSVIGEWCNLGADTNTSNLKNNYGDVKLWSYAAKEYVDSGRQFLGLMMGDHSKCAINTMFNTGTVVGVSANIFGYGFTSNFVPSFSWGGIQGFDTFRLEKALEAAQRMFNRRQLVLGQVDRDLLTTVFHQTSKWREWEQ